MHAFNTVPSAAPKSVRLNKVTFSSISVEWGEVDCIQHITEVSAIALEDEAVGCSIVLSCLCYCCIAAARTAIACGPVRQNTSAAPELICHPVGEQEESCNSDISFLYDKKLTDCFGESVNNYVGETSRVEDGSRYELADLRNFTKTGTVGYCPQSPNCMPFGKCITPSGSIGNTKLKITHNFSPYNLCYYNLH